MNYKFGFAIDQSGIVHTYEHVTSSRTKTRAACGRNYALMKSAAKFATCLWCVARVLR